MKVYNDFMRSKARQIRRLQKKSTKALDMVTATIDRLTGANEKIASAMSEINDYRDMLAVKQNELDGVMQKNLRIMQNFQALIEG